MYRQNSIIPVEFGECCEPLEADLGATLVGGLPPVDRGLPGGRLSATDIRAAIGLWPDPVVGCVCCVVPATLASGGDPVLLFKGELEVVPLALATDTGATIIVNISLPLLKVFSYHFLVRIYYKKIPTSSRVSISIYEIIISNCSMKLSIISTHERYISLLNK